MVDREVVVTKLAELDLRLTRVESFAQARRRGGWGEGAGAGADDGACDLRSWRRLPMAPGVRKPARRSSPLRHRPGRSMPADPDQKVTRTAAEERSAGP